MLVWILFILFYSCTIFAGQARGGWMFSVLSVKMLRCGAAAGAWRRGAATVTAAAALSLSGAGGPPARDAVTLL